MKPEVISDMERRGHVHARSKDIPRIRSLLASAKSVSSVALSIHLDEKTSTLIFRELYESVKQMGDALWWCLGYEAETHEAAMKILAEVDIKEKLGLHKLDRFRKMRNDSNYRGYMITASQAKEMVNFWRRCSGELISFIEKKSEG